MKKIIPSVLLALFASSLVQAAELSKIARQFIEAAASGNSDALAKTYIDAPSKDAAVKAFAEASKLIADGKIKISEVERELVIGDLGVTLVQFEIDGHISWKSKWRSKPKERRNDRRQRRLPSDSS